MSDLNLIKKKSENNPDDDKEEILKVKRFTSLNRAANVAINANRFKKSG